MGERFVFGLINGYRLGFWETYFQGFILCLLYRLLPWLKWESILEKKVIWSSELTRYQQRFQLLGEVRLSPIKEDKRYWKAERHGMYTVKSCTNILDRIAHPETFSFASLLWKGIAPPKLEMFTCLLLQGRVSTWDFLARRNLINWNQVVCPFCNEVTDEHANHLFLHCCATWIIWQRFMYWIGITVLLWSIMVKGKFQRLTFSILSYGILWRIWNVRSDLVFEDKKLDWSKLFDTVLHQLARWMKSKNENF